MLLLGLGLGMVTQALVIAAVQNAVPGATSASPPPGPPSSARWAARSAPPRSGPSSPRASRPHLGRARSRGRRSPATRSTWRARVVSRHAAREAYARRSPRRSTTCSRSPRALALAGFALTWALLEACRCGETGGGHRAGRRRAGVGEAFDAHRRRALPLLLRRPRGGGRPRSATTRERDARARIRRRARPRARPSFSQLDMTLRSTPPRSPPPGACPTPPCAGPWRGTPDGGFHRRRARGRRLTPSAGCRDAPTHHRRAPRPAVRDRRGWGAPQARRVAAVRPPCPRPRPRRPSRRGEARVKLCRAGACGVRAAGARPEPCGSVATRRASRCARPSEGRLVFQSATSHTARLRASATVRAALPLAPAASRWWGRGRRGGVAGVRLHSPRRRSKGSRAPRSRRRRPSRRAIMAKGRVARAGRSPPATTRASRRRSGGRWWCAAAPNPQRVVSEREERPHRAQLFPTPGPRVCATVEAAGVAASGAARRRSRGSADATLLRCAQGAGRRRGGMIAGAARASEAPGVGPGARGLMLAALAAAFARVVVTTAVAPVARRGPSTPAARTGSRAGRPSAMGFPGSPRRCSSSFAPRGDGSDGATARATRRRRRARRPPSLDALAGCVERRNAGSWPPSARWPARWSRPPTPPVARHFTRRLRASRTSASSGSWRCANSAATARPPALKPRLTSVATEVAIGPAAGAGPAGPYPGTPQGGGGPGDDVAPG